MLGLMQNKSLLISSLIEHAEKQYRDSEIVSRTIEGPIHRYTYADCAKRSRQLAKALTKLGVQQGDRVGTMAFNGYRHVELYFGVSGMGAVCHTVNPRLSPEHVIYILNHAEDKFFFFDLPFVPLLEAVEDKLTSVKGFVVMTDKAHMPQTKLKNVMCYEDIVNAEDDDYQWPDMDENTASALCYTSGTTGNPKGVLYSHRSTVLHALAGLTVDGIGYSNKDAILPVVPMFHVNAWGIPYSSAMCGAKMVMPGALMDGKSIYELMEMEQVTLSAGVPTVWMMLLAYVKETGKKFSSMRRTVIGGSAAPRSMIETFRNDYNVDVLHAWGMTETSPLGTACHLKKKHEGISEEDIVTLSLKQGRAVYGVEMKIVGMNGEELPWDGKACGNLLVRGPWIASGYFKGEGKGAVDADGWFDTGDVSTIDEDGYMQITDRDKDVIKSGGEWISSIDVENETVGVPGIAEAAVIAVPHPKWDERPLVIAVKQKGANVTKQDVIDHLSKTLAKWQLPDDVVFVDALPHGATGKLLKNVLRAEYKDYKLP
ncbi:MAG: long-chain-fatty-acid--CoA ligase [Proteobacteria bacterium]|nr:long-chain-fatty-acid--CoA ligase [Pseudomonadota bacterium]MBU1389976.1 long-chain-fatty-acid--CoA ligase [Pseudomonadota bacterium]MBU1545073.1 long-chain-fatty-acid--CoA ligase [Pseudomonadota bacterium]MBU2480882.1 long-chain-fatty-acid--CoA ligase [Pseudomonadota bacterium]